MGCLYILSHYVMTIAFVVYLVTSSKVHDVSQVVAFFSSVIILSIKIGYIVEEGKDNLYLIKHGDAPWYFLLGLSPENAFFAVFAFVVYFVTTWWLWWLAIVFLIAIVLWYLVYRRIK